MDEKTARPVELTRARESAVRSVHRSASAATRPIMDVTRALKPVRVVARQDSRRACVVDQDLIGALGFTRPSGIWIVALLLGRALDGVTANSGPGLS